MSLTGQLLILLAISVGVVVIPFRIGTVISNYNDFNRTNSVYKHIKMSYDDVKLFYQLDHSNFTDDYDQLYFIRKYNDDNRPHYLPTFFREEHIQVQLSFFDYRQYNKDRKKYKKAKTKQKEIETSAYATKAICEQIQKQIDDKQKTADEQIKYVIELTKQIHENLKEIK